MGSSISQQLKEQQAKSDEQTIETLTMMSKMLTNKVAATSAELESMALGDSKLPVVAIVSKTEKYKTSVSSKANDADVDSAIQEVLSGEFLTGLTTIISGALNAILGDTSAGEMEKQGYHVVFANNSLVRVDYLIYKYEFTSKGIKKIAKNAFCYYLQVGVLDLMKVNPQVLLYELSRAIDEDQIKEVEERLKELGQFAKDLYNIVPELETSQATGSLPGGGKAHEAAEEQE